MLFGTLCVIPSRLVIPNSLKRPWQNMFRKPGGYSNYMQQADNSSCTIFSLNALSHMVSLDQEGKLFPEGERYQPTMYVGRLPAALLKLTQTDNEGGAKAYRGDKSSVNKKGQTLSELREEPCSKPRTHSKVAKYKGHARALLRERTGQEIKSIIESVTTPEPYIPNSGRALLVSGRAM